MEEIPFLGAMSCKGKSAENKAELNKAEHVAKCD